MIPTLAALLFAHVLADFVFQTDWMIANKSRVAGMAAHIGTVLLTAVTATGALHPALLALAAAHLAFDILKTASGKGGVSPFLIDQAAHFASLVAVALWVPGLWSTGIWAARLPPAAADALPAMMALAAGFILATRAGGFAVGLLMAPYADTVPAGLTNAGRLIGTLERGLIFLFVLTDQAYGIGFLIAAKSVLRFGAVNDDRKASEYIIIGTLASFAWAIAAATATVALLRHLPPLGIPDLTP